MDSKRIDLIDIYKFISCIVVVYIHTVFAANDAGSIGKAIILIVNPVEFFMLCTSYFTFREKEVTVKGGLKKAQSLIKLYCFWIILYIPIIIKTFLIGNSSGNFFIGFWELLKKTVFCGYSVFWYIHAMIYAIVIFCIISKYLTAKIGVVFCLLVFLFSLSASGYYHLFDNTWYQKIADYALHFYGQIYLLRGFIYVAIGYVLSKKKFKQINLHTILICYIAAVILRLIERYLIEKNSIGIEYSCTILIPVVTTTIFLLITYFKIQIPHALFLGRCSTVIYFTHMFILMIFNAIGISQSYVRFIFSVLIGVLLTFILQTLSDKYPKFKSIKKYI